MELTVKKTLHFLLAACWLLLAASWAQAAQTIDNVDVRRDGDDAVIELTFVSEVRFVRSVVPRSSEVIQIEYEWLALRGADLAQQPRTDAARRLGAEQGLPNVIITDEADTSGTGRRLIARFEASTQARARPGKNNRSIELVLDGLGASVKLVDASTPDNSSGYVIALQSSPSPQIQMAHRVPGALQDYQLFSAKRMVNGHLLHELVIGYFATRAEAERAMRHLAGFPDAKIVAPQPPTVATSPTPAPVVAAAPPPAPAQVAVPAPPGTASTSPPLQAPPAASADVVAKAQALLATAQAAFNQQNYPAAIEALNELLNLPPNPLSAQAQELAGMSWLRSGDVARARAEFDTYLKLYPQGEAASRIRLELGALPKPAARQARDVPVKPAAETTVSGSTSMYYYGGNGQVRGQDFTDSPISGLPEMAGDPRLSTDKSQQLYTDVDLNWRRRDAEQDMRMVFRDSYTADLERTDKNRNRLSSAYFDYKSLVNHFSTRLGRQSPTGGGVMGRFDGAQLGYAFSPQWKVNGVLGAPTEQLLDTKRHFYGLAVDANSLLPNLGGGLYGIQQTIDGEVDRRAVGTELRFFKGGASIFGQLDYDTLIKGMNIQALQGTLILENNTVFNALYDRRALTMLSLSNALFFQDPAAPTQARTLQDKLATTTIDVLRQQIKLTTPYTTQAQFGVTTPLSKQYQVGVNASRTNTGAIPALPDLPDFKDGRPATGNVYTVGGQLIGLNLYSPRDTHVIAASYIHSPFLRGRTVSYNLSSVVWEVWQLEPALQYYADRKPDGGTTERVTPGLRFTYRGFKRMALESTVSWEVGKTFQPDALDATKSTKETSTRVNYSLGARYDF